MGLFLRFQRLRDTKDRFAYVLIVRLFFYSRSELASQIDGPRGEML